MPDERRPAAAVVAALRVVDGGPVARRSPEPPPARGREGETGGDPAAALEQLVADLEVGNDAPATRRAYAADWSHFADWCARAGRPALPASPETVRQYLAVYAGGREADGAAVRALRPSTLTRRLAAISRRHQEAGMEPPTRADAVRKLLRAVRRAQGTAPDKRAPLLLDDLRAVVRQLPTGLAWGVRDRALLLLGWSAALRRSELVGLDLSDVQETREGLILTIRRSKTDQEGAGHKVGVKRWSGGQDDGLCPVQAYRRWATLLAESGERRGPVFRPIDRFGRVAEKRLSPDAIAVIVKAHVVRAGIDPARFAGHSLRSGFITTAARRGVEERVIARTSRHKSMEVLRSYIHEGTIWEENAASDMGL